MTDFQKFDIASKVLVTYSEYGKKFQGWVSRIDANDFCVVDKYGEEKIFKFSEPKLVIAVLVRNPVSALWMAGMWERTQGNATNFLREALRTGGLTKEQQRVIAQIIEERDSDGMED